MVINAIHKIFEKQDKKEWQLMQPRIFLRFPLLKSPTLVEQETDWIISKKGKTKSNCYHKTVQGNS